VKNFLKILAAAFVIFGSGVLTGAFLTDKLSTAESATEARPATPVGMGEGQRSDFLDKLERSLDLSEIQRKAIDTLLQRSSERTRDVWDPVAKKLQAEVVEVREEIRKELTVEQKEKFDNKVSRPRSLNHLPRKVVAKPQAAPVKKPAVKPTPKIQQRSKPKPKPKPQPKVEKKPEPKPKPKPEKKPEPKVKKKSEKKPEPKPSKPKPKVEKKPDKNSKDAARQRTQEAARKRQLDARKAARKKAAKKPTPKPKVVKPPIKKVVPKPAPKPEPEKKRSLRSLRSLRD
jgi:hypothetical protein